MRKLQAVLVVCLFAIGLILSGCAGAPINVKGYGDADGDGIVDYDDKCPKTRYCCGVDEDGCAIDADGDGVCEPYWDKCPGTPKGCKVDDRGCPTDSDGDGVCDGLDWCPKTPKTLKVDQNGCPIPIKKELIIEFDFDKSDVRKLYGDQLKDLAAFVIGHQGSTLVIEAHTDSKGSKEYNQALSDRRAKATAAFIKSLGIGSGKMKLRGHGETWPIADNTTDSGRQKNRRAQIKVLNAFMQK